MHATELDVVTGAYSYTGRYITRRLLAMGKRVRTLTGHPNRESPFRDQVPAFPFNFDDPRQLTDSLRGATTLFNTYWVRFPRGNVTFNRAVDNTKILIQAAEEAGVHRLVHISITNASKDSPLPYFRGKGQVEEAITRSGLSYAILRPTVIFGAEDVLINNIAWLLRRFPLFAVPGRGDYRLQPVCVEDVAEIAVRAAQEDANEIMDAIGPERYSFEELVRLIAEKVHSKARIVHVSPALALLLTRILGYWVQDVMLTRDEVAGLMSNLLVSPRPPLGQTRLSDWLDRNADLLGVKYASEMGRHYRPRAQEAVPSPR